MSDDRFPAFTHLTTHATTRKAMNPRKTRWRASGSGMDGVSILGVIGSTEMVSVMVHFLVGLS